MPLETKHGFVQCYDNVWHLRSVMPISLIISVLSFLSCIYSAQNHKLSFIID